MTTPNGPCRCGYTGPAGPSHQTAGQDRTKCCQHCHVCGEAAPDTDDEGKDSDD